MFYDKQPPQQKEQYKNMLNIIGQLTLLFSDSTCPYLPYRCHENIFCKYFEAENLGRKDCSADAKKENYGIGLKTWTGQDDQKVAEFGKLLPNYKNLSGLELIKKISEYRNERIRITKNLYDISKMLYHIVKRIPNKMEIYECDFDLIDLDNIQLLPDKGNENNTYFSDGKHQYHFSISKNTLFMIFNEMKLLDTFDVKILADPYEYLLNFKTSEKNHLNKVENSKNQLCLRLYSVNKNNEKFVPERSGINQWNANGRKRNPDELYIPFPAEDKKRNLSFFPPTDKPFNLTLPDGKVISAKVCQDNDKAIMSNPNIELGKWLLRKVFELKENTVITYEMLEVFNIDCVVFTKHSDLDFSIDFGELGTYESFYKEKTDEQEESIL